MLAAAALLCWSSVPLKSGMEEHHDIPPGKSAKIVADLHDLPASSEGKMVMADIKLYYQRSFPPEGFASIQMPYLAEVGCK